MKFKKLLLLALATVSVSAVVRADLPYRTHRYDSFMGTPPAATPGTQIVFYGNSITNMHNWNEAFGSDPRVVNRGNSGGLAYELIEEVENFTDSKPAKVFIGIGTNDLSSGRTPEQVTADIRTLVRRIQVASPATEITVQSILPRSNDVWFQIQKTLPMLRDMCAEMGVTFVDLSETMMGMRTSTGSNPATTWAPDGLHPSGRGYRAWCDFIKERVNGICSYSTGDYHPELTSLSNPSRISQFSLLPVASDDILFLGDEMVENGEWNELLSLPQIKKRSNGYGHGGISLLGTNGAKDIIKVSLLTDPTTQKAPAKILIYCGVTELASGTAASTYKTNYKTLVDYIKQIAPTTKIYAVSMLSVNNDALAQQYNTALKELADADNSLTYIDIYTELKANAANSMQSNYVNGRGYVRIANLLAPYLTEDGAKAVSIDEFEKYYAARLLRKELGKVYNNLYSTLANTDNFGDAYGLYTPGSLTAMTEAAADIETALAGNTLTEAESATLIQKANAAMSDGGVNMPTGFDGRYYRLTSARSNASLTVAGQVINGVTANDATTDGNDVWRFEARPDGTVDIISLTGKYIVPSSGSTSVSVSVADSRPAMGWKTTTSNYAPGTIVIYGESGSTRWQLNQQSGGTNVWNWYGTSFPNLTDQGCAYYLREFKGRYDDPTAPEEANGSWRTLTIHSFAGSRADVSGWTTTAIADGTTHLQASPTEYRQSLNGSYYYYGVAINTAPEAAEAAKAFFYVTDLGDNTYTFRSSTGHYIMANGCASISPVNITATPHSTEKDVYSINWCVWKNNNIGSPTDLLGKFGSENTNFLFADADITPYDVYTVTIIGMSAATDVSADRTITLSGATTYGPSTVYPGGTFFVAKGTEIKPEMIQVETTPENIVITDGQILIDYSSQTGTVTGLTISDTEAELTAGQTQLLTATIEPAGASGVVTYTSSNPEVATVNSLGGLVTAVSPGTATITAKCGLFTATCTVTVKATVSGITLSDTEAELTVGQTKQLTATTEPADATPEHDVTFTSSNPEVATVSADGLITAVSAGTTTITAAYDSFTATCTVTVTDDQSGIVGINADAKSATVYDISGRRINGTPASGLYIINGRKALVK